MSGPVFRRELFVASGGFDESILFAEDWALWQRLERTTSLLALAVPAARIRRRRGSMLRDGAYETHLHWLEQRVDDDVGRAHVALDTARRALLAGHRADAARLAERAHDLGAGAHALAVSWAAKAPAGLSSAMLAAREQVRRRLGAAVDARLPAPWGKA
jgi:hypothetical protein